MLNTVAKTCEKHGDVYCIFVTMWYPGSGVVLDCSDSWSLPSFILQYNSDYKSESRTFSFKVDSISVDIRIHLPLK